jgi:hypothetical protein
MNCNPQIYCVTENLDTGSTTAAAKCPLEGSSAPGSEVVSAGMIVGGKDISGHLADISLLPGRILTYIQCHVGYSLTLIYNV